MIFLCVFYLIPVSLRLSTGLLSGILDFDRPDASSGTFMFGKLMGLYAGISLRCQMFYRQAFFQFQWVFFHTITFICIGRQNVIIMTCFIEHEMRLVLLKFQSITLQISVYRLFIILEKSQDHFRIPKAYKFDQFNIYIMIFQPPTVAILSNNTKKNNKKTSS